MRLTCNNGRMPGPCQFAWGVTIITCVAVIALVLSCVNGTAGAGSISQPAPAKETSHAQP